MLPAFPILFGRGGGIAWVPPFDTLPSAFAAVGFCKLYASYSGPIVLLRRASDNAEQDFYAAANGWVDPFAVGAWAGGDAFVITRYDQTGNGHHITQLTVANQAKITTQCRSLITDGVNDTAAVANALSYSQNVAGLTHGAVAISNSVSSQVLFQTSTPVPNTRYRTVRLGTGNLASQTRRLDADVAVTVNTPSDMGSIWHRIIHRRDYGNATATLVLDGVSNSSAAGTAGSTSNTASLSAPATESSGAGADFWIGQVSSHILFQSALSDPNMALLDTALTAIYNGVLAVQ